MIISKSKAKYKGERFCEKAYMRAYLYQHARLTGLKVKGFWPLQTLSREVLAHIDRSTIDILAPLSSCNEGKREMKLTQSGFCMHGQQ